MNQFEVTGEHEGQGQHLECGLGLLDNLVHLVKACESIFSETPVLSQLVVLVDFLKR